MPTRQEKMKQMLLDALQNPTKYDNSRYAMGRILYWAEQAGITMPVTDEALLVALRMAFAGNGHKIGLIRVQVEAIEVE